jgi:hypothetical protein
MDYVLILVASYAVATAEFFTKPACEDAGKAYLRAQQSVGNGRYTYECVPKAQSYRAQHEQE